MSGFSADWLALRGGADGRARSAELAARLEAHFSGRGQVRVLDLGAGTGANMRAAAPLIRAAQHWVLADNDAALLAQAAPVAGATLETRAVDLSLELEALFDPAPDLVTASAFFDLCGADWIGRLARAAARARAAVYATLTYDGREEWAPAHPLDAEALAALHADQRRDKGLGPALGPEAHGALAVALGAEGYAVAEAASDWELEAPRDAALIAALAAGSAAAVAPALGEAKVADWRAARTGASRVLIGHRDLLAIPPP